MLNDLVVRPGVQFEIAEEDEIEKARVREMELARTTDNVTIVVSARNEIGNLPRLLPRLLRFG